MCKIIDKINNKTMTFDTEIEQGFYLDEYLKNNKEFYYNWVDYCIILQDKDIIIDYKQKENKQELKQQFIKNQKKINNKKTTKEDRKTLIQENKKILEKLNQ